MDGISSIGSLLGSIIRARPQTNPEFLQQVNSGLTPSVNPYLEPTSQLKRVFGNNADDLNMAYALSTAQGRQETENAMKKMTKDSDLATKRLQLTAKLEALRDASLNAYREGNLRLGAQLESQRDQAMNAMQQGNMVLADQLASGRDMKQAALGMLRDKAQSELRNQAFDYESGTTAQQRLDAKAPLLRRQQMLNKTANDIIESDDDIKNSLLDNILFGDQWKEVGAGGTLLNTGSGRVGVGMRQNRVPIFNSVTDTKTGTVTQVPTGAERVTMTPGAIEGPVSYLRSLRQNKDGSPEGISDGFDSTPYRGMSIEELLRGIPGTPLQPQQPQMPQLRLRNPAL